MTTQIKRRRGTATQHGSFTGAEAEITVNTTNESIHVHDGSTAGGFELARADGSNVTTFAPSGIITANAGIKVDNITIDGTEIDLSSGNLTIDVAGGIILDADAGEVQLHDGGTEYVQFKKDSNDVQITSGIQDGDILFRGNDGGSMITALTLDMSDAGTAIFNHDISLADNSMLKVGAGNDLALYHDGSNSYIDEGGTGELRLKTNGTAIRFQHGDETMSLYTADGSVELYHDDSKKFETTSSGIAVTGSSTLDDILLTTVALPGAGVPSIALRNTDNNIYHQSGSGNSIIFLDSSQNTMHNISPTTHVFNISNAELMRINNKGLLINTNETLHSGVERSLEVLNHSGNGFVAIFKGDTAGHETVAIHNSATSGTRILLAFKTSGSTGTLVGRVTSDGSSTTYATSSDYRLKENVTTSWDATTRLKQLKPSRFNFIIDADKTVDGFLAHEVSSIVPEAITGEKDATEDIVNVVLNADGTINCDGVSQSDWTAGKSDETYASDTTWVASKTVPSYQGIDQSKLVPLLVKTIQELEARITALESA